MPVREMFLRFSLNTTTWRCSSRTCHSCPRPNPRPCLKKNQIKRNSRHQFHHSIRWRWARIIYKLLKQSERKSCRGVRATSWAANICSAKLLRGVVNEPDASMTRIWFVGDYFHYGAVDDADSLLWLTSLRVMLVAIRTIFLRGGVNWYRSN